MSFTRLAVAAFFAATLVSGVTIISSAQEGGAGSTREPVLAEPATEPDPLPAPRRRHFVYELSYTSTDRVIGVLKALGYETIEFNSLPGDSPYARFYDPTRVATDRLPIIVKMLDAPKTSLMDPDPAEVVAQPGMAPMFSHGAQAVPDIGGTYLHQSTSGEPQERLLIIYDPAAPQDLERLLATISEDLDVPARQVVISALVLEINVDRIRELGFQFSGDSGRNRFEFQEDAHGMQLPFTWIFDSGAEKASWVFSARLKALIDNGDAEILSNPSVLVLDGRQARIQVGQQVPVVNSTSTAAGITSSVEYFPVGIVLNLRPRISESGREVTMQVETIVSAVAQSSASTPASVFFAPTVDNRQVQTFVRVADNTPFIIGGLISTAESQRTNAVPGLSRVPVIGRLFESRSEIRSKREVVVVLTPHVVPDDDLSFSYVIPKDSARFDSLGRELFRNAYRLRSTDLYDLSFVHESDVLRELIRSIEARSDADPSLRRTEPYVSLLNGVVPGESILIRRMLWEIIRRSNLGSLIEPEQILVFQPSRTDPDSTDFEVTFLDSKLAELTPSQNALLISFDARTGGTVEHPFVQPKANISLTSVTPAQFDARVIEENRRDSEGEPRTWSILLSDAYSGSTSPLDTLRHVLVLKRVLALNKSLPRSIDEFRVGRQIILPTPEDIDRSVHVVDREAARLFYEVKHYYRAFEQEFNSTTRQIMNRWREDGQ
jgi:general secretion pathway protein D